jgi:hypothetical protein
MATPSQYSWSRHPELTKNDISRSFILARTKLRAYNYSCTSFLDIVEDQQCCNDPTKSPCLRIRVGSRREASLNVSPLDINGGEWPHDVGNNFDDYVQYRNLPIRMWPPPASRCPCAKRLHDILNPPFPSLQRSVTGVLDDRTLVFMVECVTSYDSKKPNPLRTIVVIDFTRPWRPIDNTSSGLPQMRHGDCKIGVDTNIDCSSKAANHINALHWQ